MARKTGDTGPAGTRSVLYPCPREGGALSDSLPKKCSSSSLPSGNKNAKSPASEEAGRMIRMDQSPLRRDQIRVKPSSPSTFTSEA
ncbi:hypothetical protein ACVWZZ_003231 [Bradyrhizobium sp. LM6.10]